MHRLLFCLCILAACCLGQQSSAQLSGDSIVAQVGERSITVKEFIDGYEFGPAFPKRKENSKSVYLKYWINENLLSLDAESRGLDTSGIFKTVYKDIYSDILTEALYRQEITPRVGIADAEIEKGIAAANFEITLKWLFCETDAELHKVFDQLKQGVLFDSLFKQTLPADVFPSDRELTTTKFNLFKKNPVLAAIVDSLHEGMISKPVQGADGWYIVRIESITRNGIVTESAYASTKQEVRNYLVKSVLDKESDRYVDSLMRQSNFVIDGDAFRIARAYVGKYELKKKTFDDWQLGESAEKAADKLKKGGLALEKQPLVASAAGSYLLNDFIAWFSSRSPYLKFPVNSKAAFSREIEVTIWRMVRDNLLTAEASKKGLAGDAEVIRNARLWKNKILYAIGRDELMNSLRMGNKTENPLLISTKKVTGLTPEISSAINNKLTMLKKRFPVMVNTKLLEKLPVSEENNPKAIDIFTAKRGGIFPHPAFPSIDQMWSAWE